MKTTDPQGAVSVTSPTRWWARGLLSALLSVAVVITATSGRAQSSNGFQLQVGQGSTIFLVRHAERADGGGVANDPGLSDAGRARAVSLASMLKDANITAIFVSEFRRTRETAAPLANSLGIAPTTVPSGDLKGLPARLRRTAGNVLVVGHSDTLRDLMSGLGLRPPVIAETDYDNLFIVSTGLVGGPARVVRLHYR